MSKQPVIAVIDVGKTNKKIFLFDEQYQIVFEKSARFNEITDEDGDICENIDSLKQSVINSISEVIGNKNFDLKAVNFSTYGASLAYVNKAGDPIAPLYNYLKPYPPILQEQFYNNYGGVNDFSLRTASPALGSLNSGMQFYRIKQENPSLFAQTHFALHLPQYLSTIFTKKFYTDITSIGCHTNLWDFKKNSYHEWVEKEGLISKLAPILSSQHTLQVNFQKRNFACGIGLHDSSAALIPYLVSFQEPFILLSTGTWCISLNPFNQNPLSANDLAHDCLCFLSYKGIPIKASRLFAGHEHEQQTKRIAAHFNQNIIRYRTIDFDPALMNKFIEEKRKPTNAYPIKFADRNLNDFVSDTEAYHQLILDIVDQQFLSTSLVIEPGKTKRIFVDGGFSKNNVFMNLLAFRFPSIEIYAASMAQATALGAAIAIHESWNKNSLPNHIIELRYYAINQKINPLFLPSS
ncbi:MAG: carbohydrate kinase [Sphingobacteriia bacterium]|nr:MAG: carbohydrate kinase [Sphingobacteriia bacterium]TAH06856.1 MAG: carbohydrate kinase [Sphingobacteriia bacterium]